MYLSMTAQYEWRPSFPMDFYASFSAFLSKYAREEGLPNASYMRDREMRSPIQKKRGT